MFRNNTVNKPVKTYSYVKKRRIPRSTANDTTTYDELPYYSFDRPEPDIQIIPCWWSLVPTATTALGMQISLKQLPSFETPGTGTLFSCVFNHRLSDVSVMTSFVQIKYIKTDTLERLYFHYGFLDPTCTIPVEAYVDFTGIMPAKIYTITINNTGWSINELSGTWESQPVSFPSESYAKSLYVFGADFKLVEGSLVMYDQIRNCKINKIKFIGVEGRDNFIPCKKTIVEASGTITAEVGIISETAIDVFMPGFNDTWPRPTGKVNPIEDIPPIKFTTFKKYDEPTATEKAPISLSVLEK